MANRVILTILVGVFVSAMLAGCGQNTEVNPTNSTPTARDSAIKKGATGNADESPDRPTKTSYK